LYPKKLIALKVILDSKFEILDFIHKAYGTGALSGTDRIIEKARFFTPCFFALILLQ